MMKATHRSAAADQSPPPNPTAKGSDLTAVTAGVSPVARKWGSEKFGYVDDRPDVMTVVQLTLREICNVPEENLTLVHRTVQTAKEIAHQIMAAGITTFITDNDLDNNGPNGVKGLHIIREMMNDTEGRAKGMVFFIYSGNHNLENEQAFQDLNADLKGRGFNTISLIKKGESPSEFETTVEQGWLRAETRELPHDP